MMATAGGVPARLVTAATLDPSNVTSYRDTALTALVEARMGEKLLSALTLEIKCHKLMGMALDMSSPKEREREVVTAVLARTMSGLGSVVALGLPHTADVKGALSSTLGRRFALGAVTTALEDVIKVGNNCTVVSWLDAARRCGAILALAAVHDAGGFADHNAATLARTELLRPCLLRELPLALLKDNSVGFVPLYEAFTEDCALVQVAQTKESQASAFVAVLPAPVRRAVQEFNHGAVLIKAPRLEASLMDAARRADALAWLAQRVSHMEQPRVGGIVPPAAREERTPQQEQYRQDRANRRCFECHQPGHLAMHHCTKGCNKVHIPPELCPKN